MKRLLWVMVILALPVLLAADVLATFDLQHQSTDKVDPEHPDQFKITNLMADDRGRVAEGTGYFAWYDGGVLAITVEHVIQGERLLLQNADYLITTDGFSCSEGEIMQDGSCRLSLGESLQSGMVRDVSSVPEEVSIYNPSLQMWTPFVVTRITEDGFYAEGVEIDIDGDNQPDMLSQVCLGMSGSPMVESYGGVPATDDQGRIISRGELSQMYYITDIKARCSPSIFVINLELPH